MTATALSVTETAPITDEWQASRQLEQLFERCFSARFQTCLRGGAEEPLYEPAARTGQPHVIYYREDFFNSALHEIAHWCIAGRARRRQLDYGYWYESESRDEDTQHRFEAVEVKPQAVEWHLALACGRAFDVSLDNLTGLEHRRDPFAERVAEQATLYLDSGLPARAEKMCAALVLAFAGRRARPNDFPRSL